VRNYPSGDRESKCQQERGRGERAGRIIWCHRFGRRGTTNKPRILSRRRSDSVGKFSFDTAGEERGWRLFEREEEHLKTKGRSHYDFKGAGIIAKRGLDRPHVRKEKRRKKQCT